MGYAPGANTGTEISSASDDTVLECTEESIVPGTLMDIPLGFIEPFCSFVTASSVY